jgi:hypothetical protein
MNKQQQIIEVRERLASMYNVVDDIDNIIYRVGDCEKQPSEDQLLNMLIGMNEMYMVKHERVCTAFEQLVKKTHEQEKLDSCTQGDCCDNG